MPLCEPKGQRVHPKITTLTLALSLRERGFSLSFVSPRLMTVHPKIPTSRAVLQIVILTKGAAATGESSHVEVDIPWDGTPLARDSGYLKMTPPHRTSKGEDNSTEEGKEVRIVKHGACHCRP